MKERMENLKAGMDEIRTFYDRIVNASTRGLYEIMPSLGDSFPENDAECGNIVPRNLGNKFFEGLTRLKRVYKDKDKYLVSVNSFSLEWDEVPVFDKLQVLVWMRDILESRSSEDTAVKKAKITLVSVISEIKMYLDKISALSDKLLDGILPEQGDFLNINENPSDEHAIYLFLDDFDHPETIVKFLRSEEGALQVYTNSRILDWTGLPSFEKTLFLNHILEKLCAGETNEI